MHTLPGVSVYTYIYLIIAIPWYADDCSVTRHRVHCTIVRGGGGGEWVYICVCVGGGGGPTAEISKLSTSQRHTFEQGSAIAIKN